MWGILVIPCSCSFCVFFPLLCFYFFVPLSYVESANSFWSETRSGIRGKKKLVFSAQGGKNTPQSRSKGNKIFKIQPKYKKMLVFQVFDLPQPLALYRRPSWTGTAFWIFYTAQTCCADVGFNPWPLENVTWFYHSWLLVSRTYHTWRTHTCRPPDHASISKHLWAHVLTGRAPASPVRLDLCTQALTLAAYRFRNNGGRQCAGGWKVKTMRRHKEATCSGLHLSRKRTKDCVDSVWRVGVGVRCLSV